MQRLGAVSRPVVSVGDWRVAGLLSSQGRTHVSQRQLGTEPTQVPAWGGDNPGPFLPRPPEAPAGSRRRVPTDGL
jgi:hypothetical protein